MLFTPEPERIRRLTLENKKAGLPLGEAGHETNDSN